MIPSDIMGFARTSVNEPWGLGDAFLQTSESQPPYYRFLHKLVKHYTPQLVVECGVYMATGSVHMALGNRETNVVGIDIAPHTRAYSALLLYNNFHLLVGDTTEDKIFAEVDSKFPNSYIGLLFLDSKHDGITAIKEYNLWRKKFAQLCIVACDDILDPRMEMFWSKLPGEKLELNFLHPAQYPGYPDAGFGISVVREHGTPIKHNHST